MNISSTNPQNVDALIKAVSTKLNIPPEQLKKELEAGKFDKAMQNMKPEETAKFNQVLKNPKMLEKLMSAPQAQALYKKLSGEK